MTNIDRIQALAFDVFGTVVDWRGTIIRDGEAFGRKHGLDLDWAAFADEWRGLYQPAMSKVRDGEIPFVKLDVLHRMNLDDLLARHGITGLTEDAIEELNRVWHRLDPWPDAVAGLQRLRRRFILVTLSNGNVRLIVDMAKRAGLPWDMVLGAEVVRHYKPQPSAYLKSVELLSLEPAECLMIAAHASDLQAAASCGMPTAFVPRPLEHGPGTYREPDGLDAFDFVADDFLDLAQQLGC